MCITQTPRSITIFSKATLIFANRVQIVSELLYRPKYKPQAGVSSPDRAVWT